MAFHRQGIHDCVADRDHIFYILDSPDLEDLRLTCFGMVVRVGTYLDSCTSLLIQEIQQAEMIADEGIGRKISVLVGNEPHL